MIPSITETSLSQPPRNQVSEPKQIHDDVQSKPSFEREKQKQLPPNSQSRRSEKEPRIKNESNAAHTGCPSISKQPLFEQPLREFFIKRPAEHSVSLSLSLLCSGKRRGAIANTRPARTSAPRITYATRRRFPGRITLSYSL